jgi:hypothetical protein
MDISKIDGVSEPFLNQTRQEEQQRRRTDETRQSDKLQISPEAQKAAEVSRLVSLAKQIPDIREDKVAQAQARLQSQEPQDEDVNRTAAARLLDDLL